MPDAGRSEGEEVEGKNIRVRAFKVGLEPFTTYAYCLVATNEVGETFGRAAYFATPGTQPEAPITEKCGVSLVSPTAYRMCGTVNPNNENLRPLVPANTGYSFYYTRGKSCEEGEDLWGGVTATGNATAVAAEVSGLTPGTQYTYCLVAWNPFGSTPGEALTFMTASEPPPVSGEEGGSTTRASSTSQIGAPLATANQGPIFGVSTEPTKPVARTTFKSTKALTKAQKLARAMSLCKKEPKRKRAGCEKRARRMYGTTPGKRVESPGGSGKGK